MSQNSNEEIDSTGWRMKDESLTEAGRCEPSGRGLLPSQQPYLLWPWAENRNSPRGRHWNVIFLQQANFETERPALVTGSVAPGDSAGFRENRASRGRGVATERLMCSEHLPCSRTVLGQQRRGEQGRDVHSPWPVPGGHLHLSAYRDSARTSPRKPSLLASPPPVSPSFVFCPHSARCILAVGIMLPPARCRTPGGAVGSVRCILLSSAPSTVPGTQETLRKWRLNIQTCE